MAGRKLWLAPLALLVGAGAASPDTLYLEDGRRITGELISVNRNMVVFDQQDEFSRSRRMRVRIDTVERIDLRDNDVMDDDDGYTTDDRWGQGSTTTGREMTLSVPSTQTWTDTGIYLQAGEVFRLDSSGFVNWGNRRSDGPNGEVNSPYNANRPLPNRAGGALIGRIGNGEPFFIGAGVTSFRAGNSGRLILGINDDYLRDNSGSFRVTVSR